MDAYEATKIVFQRIQALDPDNASKIMGVLLIQDHGEKEMIRLAFGPEALVHSVILKAKKELGLASSNGPSTPSTPSSPSPFANPLPFSRQNSSSRLFNGGSLNAPSPLSIPNQSSCWSNSSFSDFQSSDDLVSSQIGYTASSPSTMNSSVAPFYGNGEVDLIDELQLQDQLSFLSDGSPPLGPKSPEMYYAQQDMASSPSGNGSEGLLFPSSYGSAASWGGMPHRRSCSVSDICLGSDDLGGGFGWKPCLYYARGYCKNGTSCRFLHAEGGAAVGTDGGGTLVGSPGKFEMMDQCQEMFRSKAEQQQRLATASQLMAATNFPYSPVAANKCMNLLLQQQLQAESPRGSMMGDDMHKFGRTRFERGDFGMNVGLAMAPSSRQIYLTFPADSTFKEEDVSNYFSIYGPVQDVRIPYQQKRMFGFVTFVYPETVKLILAKGNPHFVCDARVLVKPYKEKGKIPDKHRRQQQMERGEFAGCISPREMESRDAYDLGSKMFCNAQDMLWRRKLEEQADLEQAIGLQSRRLMGLQLFDLKRSHHHRALSTGAMVSSPVPSPSFLNQNVVGLSNNGSREGKEENGSFSTVSYQENVAPLQEAVNGSENKEESFSVEGENSNEEDKNKANKENGSQESSEHNLPDNLFASPKAAEHRMTAFSSELGDSSPSRLSNNLITSSLFTAPASLDMAPLNHVMSRFHETVGI